VEKPLLARLLQVRVEQARSLPALTRRAVAA
jgi:hypothetical protein